MKVKDFSLRLTADRAIEKTLETQDIQDYFFSTHE